MLRCFLYVFLQQLLEPFYALYHLSEFVRFKFTEFLNELRQIASNNLSIVLYHYLNQKFQEGPKVTFICLFKTLQIILTPLHRDYDDGITVPLQDEIQ